MSSTSAAVQTETRAGAPIAEMPAALPSMWRALKRGFDAEPWLLAVAFSLSLLAALPDALMALWLMLLADGFLDVLPDVLVEVELRLLGDVSDGRALRDVEITFVVGVATGEDLHERRLADAVHAEHAHAIARHQAEGSALQDLAVAESASEPLRDQDRLSGIESLHRALEPSSRRLSRARLRPAA